MSKGGTLSIRAVRPVVEGLRALDVDTGALLSFAGISVSLLRNPDVRVPHSAVMKLWQRAIEVSGDPSIGLRVAEHAPLESFDLHGYAVLSSSSPREAYRRSVRYHRLIHDSTAHRFDEDRDGGTIRHAMPGGLAAPRHTAEFLSATWLRFGRLVAGTDWCPTSVSFGHPEPEERSEAETFFGCPIRFREGGTSMRIPAAVLDLRNRKSDPQLVAIMDRYAESLLASIPRRDSWSDRVRAEVASRLSDGAPTIREIAGIVGSSSRSLSRRLREENTTFSELVDHERRDRALSLLRRPEVTIGEVAFLCGFGDTASFHRAFRRWTETTPASYRDTALRG